MPLLELSGLVARYGAAPVLKGLDLVVEEGDDAGVLEGVEAAEEGEGDNDEPVAVSTFLELESGRPT